DQQATVVPFSRSQVTITGGGGGFPEDEAKDLALVLDFGALPVELEPQQSRIVSATLGEDALDAGVVAGLIGLGLVSIYLIVYYRLLGLVAILSLGVSGSLLWTIIAWLGESKGLALTLAGVTGLIVSIGVSVDSNVVYYEHLKEDVRSGRTVRSAVDRAFPIAFKTIVKADVASLIAAAVLYFLTVGQVKGFALYLGLATILDLVATFFFMGPTIRLLARRAGLYTNPARFGIPAPEAALS
ncbi:MAG: SecD/SecF family protein translocase subunit, partial [Acidimicrobiales bacterium]